MSHSDSHSHGATRRVLRALGIFGSLEAVTMLCAVARTKLIALWIGTAGVGIISLFNSTLELLKATLQLNLRQSAVRQIAAAPAADRPLQCSAARRCGLLLGIVSALITAVAAPWLSRLTFDSAEYTWGFVVLAFTMLATAVSAARSAVLQALDDLQGLARASLRAAVTSTVLAVALIYMFRMQAIVPVLFLFPCSTLLFLLLQPAVVPSPDTADLPRRPLAMKAMLRLGGWLTLAAAVTLAADYALRVYINSTAGLDAVGIFQAGYTIVNTYLGVIFTAIAMEFFPRLSATIGRRHMTSTVVSHEIAVVTWIVIPVSIACIALDRIIIGLLYSGEFVIAADYITIGAAATSLRAASWCMAYVIISKGDGVAYVVTETLSSALMLGLSIPLWHARGYTGLGCAYALQYVFYTLVTWLGGRRRYGLRLSRGAAALIWLGAASASAALLLRAVSWWTPLLLLFAAVPAAWRHLRR